MSVRNHYEIVINMKKETQLEIEDVKRKILPILEQYGVKKAGLFGSVVRGELREDSDNALKHAVFGAPKIFDF